MKICIPCSHVGQKLFAGNKYLLLKRITVRDGVFRLWAVYSLHKFKTEANALFLHSFKQTTSHDYLCRDMFNFAMQYLLKQIHVYAGENQIIFIQRITASQQCWRHRKSSIVSRSNLWKGQYIINRIICNKTSTSIILLPRRGDGILLLMLASQCGSWKNGIDSLFRYRFRN